MLEWHRWHDMPHPNRILLIEEMHSLFEDSNATQITISSDGAYQVRCAMGARDHAM